MDKVVTRDIYTFDAALTADQIERIRQEFTDPVIQVSAVDRLVAEPFDWLIVVGFKPGVTDNVGRTAAAALGDILGRRLCETESVHTSTAYFITAPPPWDATRRCVSPATCWPILADRDRGGDSGWEEWVAGQPEIRVPKFPGAGEVKVGRYDLSGSDEELDAQSARKGRSRSSLEEMKAVRDHFRAAAQGAPRRKLGLDEQPTDIELEMVAQTWSEHCKHKIFSGIVHYTDEHGRKTDIHSLFKTYIQGTTDDVAKRVPWLVSVFHDNAGVIDFNERINLVYKVETHNSPSALEPYGGAMTGIVGCNRDPLGTGLGAELLINVWGYCFASPFINAGEVPEGVMHPRRLRDGVHRGVIDGGNQSGIPYGLGWEFYDDRYLAKPMVYCGTLGWLPKTVAGRPGGRKEKPWRADLVVMIGGRIGKDGIHGATFSSQELHQGFAGAGGADRRPDHAEKDDGFPDRSARPGALQRDHRQWRGGDFPARSARWPRPPAEPRSTWPARRSKYAGLQPWEIWLSEAQERMSLGVPPENLKAMQDLAKRRDVELTVLGTFTDSGYIHLKYGEQTVGLISLEFLHEGCPRMEMNAEWKPPFFAEPPLPEAGDLTGELKAMLGRLNIASKEAKCRQYDHEVKGRTVIKPLVGVKRDVPSDATVFLAEYGGREGIVLSAGFNSHYSDVDAYRMIASVVDEAVRRIVAIGGRLDFIAGLDNFCWPDPVESPATPDGRYKLAQLVRANQALYDVCTAYNVPLISGKDSMKNDSTRGVGGRSRCRRRCCFRRWARSTISARRSRSTPRRRRGSGLCAGGLTRARAGGVGIRLDAGRKKWESGDRRPRRRVVKYEEGGLELYRATVRGGSEGG